MAKISMIFKLLFMIKKKKKLMKTISFSQYVYIYNMHIQLSS